MTDSTRHRRSRRPSRAVQAALALLALLPAVVVAQQAPNTEELARRWLQSGLRFLGEGKAAEGLEDLRRVTETYPDSAVADDALLEVARYQLDVAMDAAAARAAVDALLTRYASAETAPMGFVLAGRIGVATAETTEAIDQALANFERARTLAPKGPSVPAALVHAGDAQRIARRTPEALALYRQVAGEYPRSASAAQAWLGAAAAHAESGRGTEALDALSSLQSLFPGTREADTARDWAAVLYRLYLRPAGSPFVAGARTIAGTAGRLDDVVALGIAPDGGLTVLQRDAAIEFDRDGKSRDSQRVPDARALARRPGGTLIVASRSALHARTGPAVPLTVRRSAADSKMLDDVRAVAVGRTGQLLVADGGTRTISRFTAEGGYVAPFATVDATRVAVNGVGLVAALERGGRGVVVLDAAGRPQGRLGAAGSRVALREAVDLAWDALGHLYVLDREAGAVIVVNQALEPIATYAPGARDPSLRRATAFALDAAGRLFVYDDRTKVVRVHE